MWGSPAPIVFCQPGTEEAGRLRITKESISPCQSTVFNPFVKCQTCYISPLLFLPATIRGSPVYPATLLCRAFLPLVCMPSHSLLCVLIQTTFRCSNFSSNHSHTHLPDFVPRNMPPLTKFYIPSIYFEIG